jgi:hypothetical protein
MGESFELEKKLTKIRDELNKREVDIRNRLADIEKKRVEALKKTEEMKQSSHNDIDKIDQGIIRANLGTQAKTKLTSEIATLKSEIEKKYSELRGTILGKTVST